jgi:hypothetical protein
MLRLAHLGLLAECWRLQPGAALSYSHRGWCQAQNPVSSEDASDGEQLAAVHFGLSGLVLKGGSLREAPVGWSQRSTLGSRGRCTITRASRSESCAQHCR